MERLTDIVKAEEIYKKEHKTKQEKIYLRLSNYETLAEKNELYTKEQLKIAATQALEIYSNIIKTRLAKEIVFGFIAGIKKLGDNISQEQIEKIGYELIKRIAEAK